MIHRYKGRIVVTNITMNAVTWLRKTKNMNNELIKIGSELKLLLIRPFVPAHNALQTDVSKSPMLAGDSRMD